MVTETLCFAFGLHQDHQSQQIVYKSAKYCKQSGFEAVGSHPAYTINNECSGGCQNMTFISKF